jgi:hypothetical protein
MPRYDLFQLDKGSHIWVGTAETMHEANAHAKRLVNCPECVVLDQTTGEKIVIKAGQATGHQTKTPSSYRHS